MCSVGFGVSKGSDASSPYLFLPEHNAAYGMEQSVWSTHICTEVILAYCFISHLVTLLLLPNPSPPWLS